MTIRVFRYGALKPTNGSELMRTQLAIGNRYRNALLEIELWARAARHFGTPREELKEARNQAVRDARSRFKFTSDNPEGLGWGTYQAIEAASKQSCKRMQDVWFTPKLEVRKSLSRLRPRFKRFDGTGTVAAALQRCSGDSASAVEIEMKDPKRRHAVCKLRVHSDQWLHIPIVQHRPIPEGATIVMASLHVERVGLREVYSVTLTVDEPSAIAKPKGTGRVAINFGWRVIPGEGVRVATAVGSHGIHELVLPERLIGARKHAESLRSLADETAAAFLGNARFRTRERRRALEGTRASPLNRERFHPEGKDKNNPEHLEHWARRDRHLYQWEQDETTKMMRRRREIYRLWVRKLRALYATVIIEDFDLRRVLRRDQQEIPKANHVRFLVAPSHLRLEVKGVFGDDAEIVKQKNLTQTCAQCKRKCHFDAAIDIAHQCEHCGATFDQDINNAQNQLDATAAE